ncbi:MAG: sulfatase-like hydrolase/transferase [Kangiellaceae bacterium]
MLLIYLALSPATSKFQNEFFNYTVWAHEDTIRENGRINSTIFYALQEFSYSNLLSRYSNQHQRKIDVGKKLYPKEIARHKNIHMIVMESFIDPRLIKELNLPESFISESLLEYLNHQQNFSKVVSPIYGGGTAQAEFELLTGIKALGKVNKIEFNIMQGNKINAFVNRLSNHGYDITAMIAPDADFFNSKRAYKSLGFEKIYYLQESESLKNTIFSDVNLSNEMLYDGELFDLNLKFLKDHIKSGNKPVFNYVLGMFGHLPFERNSQLRPDRVTPNHPDDRLNRIANQFYYRTEALAKYLEKLIEIDPTAIIFVTSDHLPSVLSSDAHYQLNNKINIALLINNGKTIDVSGKSMYEVPRIIWNILSNPSENPVNLDEVSPLLMDDLYFTTLAESLIE